MRAFLPIALWCVVQLGFNPVHGQTAPSNQGAAKELLIKAENHVRMANWPEAIKAYTEAIANDPNNAEAYASRGKLLGQLGRSKESLIDIQKALELNPYARYMYDEQAKAKMMLADYKGALMDLDRALEQFPADSSLLSNRARVKEQANDVDGAISDLSLLISQRPNEYALLLQRALLYLRVNRHDDALIDVTRAEELSAENGIVYNVKGMVQLSANAITDAINSFDKAIALNP